MLIVLGAVACKKTEEVTPVTKVEYCQGAPISKADSMYYDLLWYKYSYITNPNINGAPLPSANVMFDLNIKGGEFILAKGFTPWRLYLVLDTANYEVVSLSDTSINLNDNLYIRR